MPDQPERNNDERPTPATKAGSTSMPSGPVRLPAPEVSATPLPSGSADLPSPEPKVSTWDRQEAAGRRPTTLPDWNVDPDDYRPSPRTRLASLVREKGKRGLRAVISDQIPFLNSFTDAPRDTLPGEARAASNSLTRRAAGRLRRAARRNLPTFGKLRLLGSGKLLGGLEFVAKRNPFYRFILSKLPFGGKLKVIAGVGCGCVSGCGCGSSCCTCSGCIWPILLIFVLIGLSGAWVTRQPDFVNPLFCQESRASFCDENSGVGLSIDLNDVPAGAIESYKQAEADTGVPWFYLLSWEKVATNFGRADYSDLNGGTVPVDALDATYGNMQSMVEGIASSDGGPSSADQAALTAKLVSDKDTQVAALTSPLRGGSFGLMLVTNEEYTQYGQKADGSWRDPWDRTEAATIIALHLLDLYPELAKNGHLSNPGTPILDKLAAGMPEFIRGQLIEASKSGDAAKMAFYQKAIGTWQRPPSPATIKGARSAPILESASVDKWKDGPRAGQDITAPERYYICQELLPEDQVLAGGCEKFVTGSSGLDVPSDKGLAQTIADYYQPSNGAIPGEEISDWAKLQVVMGALLSDPAEWGSEQTGFFIAPTTTADGRRGENVRVNAYAQAINQYAKSAYAAWAAAQAAARQTSGVGRAEQLAYTWWAPAVDQIAKEQNIPREYLLATIKADEAYGCSAGTGSSIVPDAVLNWLAPSTVTVGKAMAGQLGFTGNTWIVLAAQVMGENSGNIRYNNPGNLRDSLGKAAGKPSYPGQLGWYAGTKYNDFASFATPEDGGRANAATYEKGTSAYGYDKVLEAGRSGDVLALARAIEASSWDENHYFSNHPLPNSSQLFQPGQPEHDGSMVKNVRGVSATAVGGCWRFGPGEAAAYTPADNAKSPDEPMAVAMNFCTAGRSDCGSAVISLPGSEKKVTVKVVDYWDGNLGEPNETIVGLRPAVVTALALSGSGPFHVNIQLLPPAGQIYPLELTASDPASGVRLLAQQLRTLSRVVDLAKVPTFEELAPAWRTYSGCEIDPVAQAQPVTDPFDPTKNYVISPWCDYLANINTYVQLYIGSGGQVTTMFGVEPVSRQGYIWPLVGAYLTSGFEPRPFGASLTIKRASSTVKVHDGIDLAQTGGQVVVDKDGWLYQKTVSAVTTRNGSLYSYTAWVAIIIHNDGFRSEYTHVARTLAGDLSAQLAASSEVREGQKVIWVEQGTTLVSLDSIARHVHYGIIAVGVQTPFKFTYAGEAATYSGQRELRIDPLSLLPQDPTMIRINGNGQRLPGWYKVYKTTDNFPPPLDPILIFGDTP